MNGEDVTLVGMFMWMFGYFLQDSERFGTIALVLGGVGLLVAFYGVSIMSK